MRTMVEPSSKAMAASPLMPMGQGVDPLVHAAQLVKGAPGLGKALAHQALVFRQRGHAHQAAHPDEAHRQAGLVKSGKLGQSHAALLLLPDGVHLQETSTRLSTASAAASNARAKAT